MTEKPVETQAATPASDLPALVPPSTGAMASDTPIAKLAGYATEQIALIGHNEIWAVTLQPSRYNTHIPTQIILQKYLNAKDGDLPKAKEQLKATLEWRKKMKPAELVAKTFSKSKFGGLGYVTCYGDEAADMGTGQKEVFTWNVYGDVKDMNATFGQLEEFISWRSALMELGVQALNLNSATTPITDTHDPYKIYQVHDYANISFFRQPPAVKTASTETIRVLGTAYPELLKEKFFVNVPAVMGFIFGIMKVFVAEKTRRKFHPMSNSKAMRHEFGTVKIKDFWKLLPDQYGGNGPTLEEQATKGGKVLNMQ